jgi:uncharacterized metal-binding protein YceD (DUF177 family)
MSDPQRPWSVPVAVSEIEETGRHVELEADEAIRARIAALAGARTLPRLHASFDIARRGADGVRVTGRVSATVGQTCVVTLEPIESEVEEEFELVFAPPSGAPPPRREDVGLEREQPEPLIGGAIDLGAIATEFLVLGIPAYPRKPGVVFDAPTTGDAKESPFAPLAGLLKDRNKHEK